MNIPDRVNTPGRVTYLAGAVAYEDGAEDEILHIFRSTRDLSDGSDELRAHIHDWPTRSHLSPLRSNLIRPLRLEPDLRVLDIGAGSGTLLRYLGEQGLDVTGLEGSPPRAEAAALRCAALPNVNVVCGPVEQFTAEPFDVVLAIGVLEYAYRHHAGGPIAFLDLLARLTKPEGILVLAIENQLGLKYLLGYNEDHLALPWVGVEGYRRRSDGIHTWSRHALAQLLTGAGLGSQRWLYPFPDYKHPTHIFTDTFMRRPDSAELIPRLLRKPVVDRSAEPTLFCDAAAAHAVMLSAHLGEDTANSFLVLASRIPQASQRFLSDGEAWLYTKDRRRSWRRSRAVVNSGHGLVLQPLEPFPSGAAPWLRIEEEPEERVHAGSPLDREVAKALAADDPDRLKWLLRLWWTFLREHAVDNSFHETSPFLPADAAIVISGQFLDANLDNFLLEHDLLTHVDKELVASPAVCATTVATRALWNLTERIYLDGWLHPWIHGETLSDVVDFLRNLAGISSPTLDLSELFKAEGQLQEIVVGLDPSHTVARAESLASIPMHDVSRSRLPFTSVVTRLKDAEAEVHRRGADIDELRSAIALRVRDVEEVQEALTNRERDVKELLDALSLRERDVNELRQALDLRSLDLSNCQAAQSELETELRSKIRSLETVLDEIAGSTSWRLTAPLRALRRQLD